MIRAGGRKRPFLIVAAVLMLARASPAQSRPCGALESESATQSVVTRWSAPLDRVVSIHVTEISLRDALDRVAAVAHLRLSYSAEMLPLDRVTCLVADAMPVGSVLTSLLAGTHVDPVVAGGEQVVLSPNHAAPAPVETTGMAASLGVLDRVVVTGSAVGAPGRELTMSLDVIDGRQLARDNVSSLSNALDAYVPGVWSWSQSPTNLLSSYASIRGASSFGLSYPKIYIDGIEVANPLLVTRFSPDAIDHIEVIRGPQGSALYGTDAISGVVNIVTKHEGVGPTAERMSLRTTAGVTHSDYPHSSVLTQNHAVSFATGTSTRSADLNVIGGSMGEFIPNGYSRDLLATGSARVVGSQATFSGSARFYTDQAGSAQSPLLKPTTQPTQQTNPANPTGVGPVQDSLPQSVSQYTVGATAAFAPMGRWTHTLIAGVDGYRLANVETNLTPIPSVADSALRAAQGGADRATFRASTVYRVDSSNLSHGSITLSAEHASLRATTVADRLAPSEFRGMPGHTEQATTVTWQSSTGLSAQADGAFADKLFFTGGMRVERDSRLPFDDRVVALPMLGVAGVQDYGPFTAKLRAAYGRGIRPPATVGHADFWQVAYGSAAAGLGPEEQSGTELGLDLTFRRSLRLQVTRFDQRASGLIQQVAMPVDSNAQTRRMMYLLENVGEITNRGWEMEASANISRLTLSGTFTAVDSRVRQLAVGYHGDLETGDRMLLVPARTASLNASWVASRWHFTVGGSRAMDWINYDELSLAQAFLNQEHSMRDLYGAQLRQYWRRYSGGARVRASMSRDIANRFSFELSGDNLLNYQRDEPDNITILPGRTLMTGLTIRF